MLVKWRPEARRELWCILDYIGDRNPIAAADLFNEIESATQALPQHPYLYRKGRVSGTRELVVNPNYIVIYRVTIDSIEVISIVHARKEYPNNAPIVSEFESAEQEARYNTWFRQEVAASLADTSPPIPHDQVMAKMDTIIAAAEQRKKNN